MWVVVCDLQMRLLWMFCFAAFVWVLLCGLFCLNVAGDCDLGLAVELLFYCFFELLRGELALRVVYLWLWSDGRGFGVPWLVTLLYLGLLLVVYGLCVALVDLGYLLVNLGLVFVLVFAWLMLHAVRGWMVTLLYLGFVGWL